MISLNFDVPQPHGRVLTLALAFFWCSGFPLSGCSSTVEDQHTTHHSQVSQSENSAVKTAQALAGSVLWSGHFQGNWAQHWQVQPQGRWGEENFEIVQLSSSQFPEFLRVHYPAQSASPSVSRKQGAPLGGGQFYAALGIASQERLHLSYSVRFPTGFDFVRGGKLPGLYGGTGNSGGNIPNGRDGFSSRLMWRQKGAGELYAYLPNSKEHGTSLGRGSWRFKPGQWQRIDQELWLNQPGQADGRAKIWIDGNLVFRQDNLVFRTAPELQIDGLFFSTFFGGGNASWATPKDTQIDFANFEVSLPSPES